MLDENIKVTLANGPRPRKHAALWQAYLWYNEWLEMKKRHLLRISAAERGASDMDAQLEKDLMEKFNIVKEKDELGRILARYGKTTGDIWYWCTEIRGLKNGVITAQLLAQIDDIERFATIAKLWRFCGWAVIDGKAEKNQPGEASHYNGRLKGVCFNIAEAFIKQQTPGYVDIYYAEKTRQRDLHPHAICKTCGIQCDHKEKLTDTGLSNIWTCPNNAKHKKMYTDLQVTSSFRGQWQDAPLSHHVYLNQKPLISMHFSNLHY